MYEVVGIDCELQTRSCVNNNYIMHLTDALFETMIDQCGYYSMFNSYPYLYSYLL